MLLQSLTKQPAEQLYAVVVGAVFDSLHQQVDRELIAQRRVSQSKGGWLLETVTTAQRDGGLGSDER